MMSDSFPTRHSWPTGKILLLVGSVVAAIVIFGIVSLINVYRKIPESYAAWTTGNLIVDYLNTYSNQWPRSWEDLDQATNCLRYIPIETLRTKVKVNWGINFADLIELTRTNRTVTMGLVTRFDGSRLHAIWGPDTEPNYKIKSYLLWAFAETNSPSSESQD